VEKPTREEEQNFRYLRDLVANAQKSRIFLTAFELGLFTALGDENKTSAEVAAAIGCDERATDRLMNALCTIGLLRKQDGLFSNTPFTAKYLVRGKPQYLAGYQHFVHLWQTWSTLTDAVRRGRSVVRREPPADADEEWTEAFIAAMHWFAKSRAPALVSMLDLSGVKRVLDIGGGSGAYSMAFVRAKDDLRATVFDLPKVISLTKRYLEAEGAPDRIELVGGNFHTSDFGEGFDLALLSAIIHSNSPQQNRDLVKKVAKALNPGGRIVIQDFIVNEDRTGPPFAAIFALNMLVATEAGDTYTESEVRSWLEEAGFSEIQRQDTPFETTLIIGRKPGV